jgi:hypothetical protein
MMLPHASEKLSQALAGVTSFRFGFEVGRELVERLADRVGLVLERREQLVQGHRYLLIVHDGVACSRVDGSEIHQQIDSLITWSSVDEQESTERCPDRQESVSGPVDEPCDRDVLEHLGKTAEKEANL